MVGNSELKLLLRIIAECIIFNLATLSPFCATRSPLPNSWDSILGCLFPGGDSTTSPFLGGLQRVYGIMLEMNMMLYQDNTGSRELMSENSRRKTLQALSQDLNELERQVPTMYPGRAGYDHASMLYKAKHKLSILALRIHLCKIASPLATSADPQIRLYVSTAIDILKRQSIYEPGNPALRWPLTIFACAARDDMDFDFLVSRMQEMERVLDPSNSQKLKLAYTVLRRHRCRPNDSRIGSRYVNRNIRCLDFLLQPWMLGENRSDGETIGSASESS